MKTGKILILVGAILTLVSTFFLSLGQTNGTLGRTHASGIGFLLNLPDIIANIDGWVAFMGGEVMVIYIVSIVYIVFLLSGFIQLVGFINRIVAIIGSVLVLVMGILIILAITNAIPGWDSNRYSSLFWAAPIADGIWPLDIPIANLSNPYYQTLSLGTITLVAGGGLGLAGGILGIKD